MIKVIQICGGSKRRFAGAVMRSGAVAGEFCSPACLHKAEGR